MPEFHEVCCTRCNLYLDRSMFCIDRSRKNGLNNWCKYCTASYRAAHREERILYRHEYRQKNPEKIKAGAARDYVTSGRRRQLEKRYGITEDIYNDMSALQGHVCAICHRPCRSGRRLAVDHNHRTGGVRGLLCSDCNTGLGKFQDSSVIVYQAARYLERSGA